MAKRKEAADKETPEEPVLAKAAKPASTSKVASPADAKAEPLSSKSTKKGKLPPKHKARLPRRQKKAQQKAATRL